jgi:hypothetical protein
VGLNQNTNNRKGKALSEQQNPLFLEEKGYVEPKRYITF